jgi:hypothetical protein
MALSALYCGIVDGVGTIVNRGELWGMRKGCFRGGPAGIVDWGKPGAT